MATDVLGAVTAEQKAFYDEKGWVRIDNVLTPEEAEAMRVEAEAIAQADAADVGAMGQLEIDFLPHRRSETIRRYATMGRLSGLLQTLIGTDAGVRLFRDGVFVKPYGEGTGIGTSYHQDFPSWPLDRSTGCTLWIALVDLPADSGTLRFVEGSHKRGVSGDSGLDQSWLDSHPEDEALLSPPQALPAGSATVHNFLTIHGSSPNESGVTRVGYAASYMSGDTRYNGAPHFATDGLGIEQFGLLDHPSFPPVGG